MNSNELLSLLENAIDTSVHSDYHSGYTAKEIHRKCITHIKLLDKAIQTLTDARNSQPYSLGWGKGKDE